MTDRTDTEASAEAEAEADPEARAGAVEDAALDVTQPLADLVAAHLRRYFALHGEALPPAGLHARVLAEVERPLLELALSATGGNQLRCAELLGLNRNTLRKRLAAHNIEVTRARRVM